MYLKISKIVAVWAKIVAVFGKIFWGGFWWVWAPKVAVSDFDLLETLDSVNQKLVKHSTPELNQKPGFTKKPCKNQMKLNSSSRHSSSHPWSDFLDLNFQEFFS